MASWDQATPFRAAAALPRARSTLVGRGDELGSLLQTLESSRLVTLTGFGGVGKTRLALAVAQAGAIAQLAPDGVAAAELAAISDVTLIADTVRTALAIPEAPGRTAATAIVERLGGAAVLLVLDNCEHLIAEAADLVNTLLDGCPELRILATSREPLAVEGESVWPVPPLSLPGSDAVTAADVAGTATGQLFEQRARAVVPTFSLTDANATAVAQLCRRLGGLPLAIELAAARVRVLSVEQIVAGLDDVFGLLVGATRTAPARQHSLRATLDWSHALLTADEQVLFRRLGVFPGSFSLLAAEVITSGGAIDTGGMLDLLTRLVDRSLLITQPAGKQMRYRLLSPIRDYARERLVAADERTSVGAAHLDFYAELVQHAEPLLSGPQQTAELDKLEVEGNNLRAALRFAAETGAPTAGLNLATGLTRLCSVRGHYQEGRQWLDWAATAEPNAPPLRAKALLGGGSLAFLSCDYPAAVRRLEASLQLFRQLEEPAGITMALHGLGGVARERGRYARAEMLYLQSLQVAEGADDCVQIAHARGYLGFLAWLQGDWVQARTESEHALLTFRQLGDGEGIVWSLLSLGTVAQYCGQYSLAAELLEQSLGLARQLGYREGVAWTLHELGLLALRGGDTGAEQLLLDALARHRALGDRWRTASVLEDLAACLQKRGEHRRTVELLAAAAAIRTAIGSELAPCERVDHDRVEAAARGHLAEEDFAGAWLHGQSSTLDEVIAASPAPATSAPGPIRPAEQADHGGDPRHGSSTASVQRLRIRALGTCSVHRGDHLVTAAEWGYGKPRELFFLLASAPSQTKSDIGTALWPDLDGSQLRNAFHTALRDLRRAVGDPGWILYAAGRYTLDRSRDHWSDIEIFEEALAAGRRRQAPGVALPHLQRAVAAYGGEFGPDLPDADWVRVRRTELDQAYTQALSGLGRLLGAAGRYDQAADIYRTAISRDPLDEGAHRHLMICLSHLGEIGQAARHYQELARRLHEELGVVPASETRAVFQQLSRPD